MSQRMHDFKDNRYRPGGRIDYGGGGGGGRGTTLAPSPAPGRPPRVPRWKLPPFPKRTSRQWGPSKGWQKELADRARLQQKIQEYLRDQSGLNDERDGFDTDWLTNPWEVSPMNPDPKPGVGEGVISKPEQPAVPAQPRRVDMSGWTLSRTCGAPPNPPWGGGGGWQGFTVAGVLVPCPTHFQVSQGAFPPATGTTVPGTSGMRSLFEGPTHLTMPSRYSVVRQWNRPSPRPTPAIPIIPATPAIPAVPPVITPLPDLAPLPSRVQRAPRTQLQTKPRSYIRGRVRLRTRIGHGPGVRAKPAPYNPPANTRPPGETPVPNVPKPGEEKWKMPSTGTLGSLYGSLTEVKDALKCIEKNIAGHRVKGGLAERIARAAHAIADNPNRVKWDADDRGPGVMECLVANHIEDAVIGKVNQLANRITRNPYWVRPVGVGAGSWSQRMS